MKLLLDENLSRRLAARLADLFPEIIHASDCALLESADSKVWEYGRLHGFTIVTTGADFFGDGKWSATEGHLAPPMEVPDAGR